MWDGTIGIVVVVNHRTHYHSRGWNWKEKKRNKKKYVCYIKTKKNKAKRAKSLHVCPSVVSSFLCTRWEFFSLLVSSPFDIFMGICGKSSSCVSCVALFFRAYIECMSWSCEIINTECCFFLWLFFFLLRDRRQSSGIFSTRWSVFFGWKREVYDGILEFKFLWEIQNLNFLPIKSN